MWPPWLCLRLLIDQVPHFMTIDPIVSFITTQFWRTPHKMCSHLLHPHASARQRDTQLWCFRLEFSGSAGLFFLDYHGTIAALTRCVHPGEISDLSAAILKSETLDQSVLAIGMPENILLLMIRLRPRIEQEGSSVVRVQRSQLRELIIHQHY